MHQMPDTDTPMPARDLQRQGATRWPWRVAALAAAPVVAGLVVTLIFVAAESAGLRPFARAAMNPSEAAAAGEAHVLVRLLHEGASPLTRYPVGTDIIEGPAPQMLTPLEAAAVRDQAAIIRLLEARVPIDSTERVRLVCLARQAGARDTAAAMQRDGLDTSPEACRQAGVPDQR